MAANRKPWGKALEDIIATISDFRPRRVTDGQRELGKRLVSDLKKFAATSAPGVQSEFWHDICAEFCACAEAGDPMYFMRWPPVAATMVQGTTPHAIAAYRILRRSAEWRTIWRSALRHAPYGHPPPFLPNLRTTAITVQHASHLHIFRERTGRSFLDVDCIVEIGGGYGSMCRLAKRLGFQGQYLIFDQPPILALQRYYLGLNGIPAEYDIDGSDKAVGLFRSIDGLKALMASTELGRIALLSTWALSEMPLGLRDEVEAMFDMEGYVNAMLAYQEQFTGIDNCRYFNDLVEKTNKSWAWQHFEIDFCRKNYYVLGLKRLSRG